ncbi:MAG: serine/threonine-protein phosphatase, partial [Phycisphaerae bacterium]|nr:serine/threonine-protein phosphatase [Phycisphaerae bacterium]
MGSVSLHAVNHPAKEVAGDFYDYFETERPGVLGVLIADVSGKGVPAALFMAVAKTVIRNLARGGDLPPGEVLTRANQLLLENNDDQSLMFVTLFFFYYDTKTGTVTYANAGHNRPFVLSLDGRMRKVDGQSGPLLGALEDRVYAQGEETLQAGEALVMYTDGVTEAMAPEGVQFGEERLVKLLGELAGSDARRLSERIVREVDTFEDHRHGDDITVLAVQRRA